jgi:hypothetical protein
MGPARRVLLPTTAFGRVRLACGVLAALVALAALALVLRPLAAHAHGYGGHDWDAAESQRYLVWKAIVRFHEFPFWNPYACGGHPAWGAFDGDTVVVSPWLPAYLVLSLPVALRVEIVGSAILGAVGAWLLASRFTSSHAARAFVAVVFAVNSRWALHVAAGDAWHLAYAWTPWALFFLDRAMGTQPTLGPTRARDAVWAGACLAMMVYGGGVYPLPQTAAVMGAYAVLVAIATRSARPLAALGLSAVVAFGLSAPKLLPVLEVAGRYARPVDSTAFIGPMQVVQLLTSREQGLSASHAGVPPQLWHDVGMYVGWPALLILGAGVVVARGLRGRPLAAIGLALVALGLGSFSRYAPWALVHDLPIFRWQSDPFAWLYPAALLLSCVAVEGLERGMARAGGGRALLEVAAVLAVAWIALDMAAVARLPLLDELHEPGPRLADSVTPFHVEQHLPKTYDSEHPDRTPRTLPAETANVGTIECNTFGPLSNYPGLPVPPGYDARSSGLGAHGVGEADYHGEAYVTEGGGTATAVRWTPNAVDVRVRGARAGALAAINQNWDGGWSVDGARAIEHHSTVAAPMSAPDQTLRFRYRPRTWWPGVLIFAVTVATLFLARRAGRTHGRQSGFSRTLAFSSPARSRSARTIASMAPRMPHSSS